MSEISRLYRDMARASYGAQRALLEQLARSAEYLDSLPRCARCRRLLSDTDTGPALYDTRSNRTTAICSACAEMERAA